MKKRTCVTGKVIAGLLAATMMLSSCGSFDSSTPTTGTNDETQSAVSEAPTELTVMAWDRGNSAPGTTADNNTLTKWIAEQVLKDCNIKVTFVPVPRNTADDKLNVMMAGGSAPDVVFTYTRTLVMDYAQKGGLVELTPYLEQYGSDITANLGDVQHVGYMSDGQYALMQKASTTADGLTKASYGSYIRKDWVDKLGKELPTNQDELIALLREFKEKDPGQVGQDKLIPWAMSGLPDGSRNFLPFVSSYADACDDERILVYDDRLATVAPGTKEALRIMNQLYNEGIITRDFPVDTSADKYKQDITNGNVGFFIDHSERPINEDYLTTLKQNVPEAEFVPVNVCQTADGNYLQTAEDRHKRYVMIPKNNEDNIEAAMTYLNWMANAEIAEKIACTPEITHTNEGLRVELSTEEKSKKGYPSACSDYNLLNGAYDVIEKDQKVKIYMSSRPELGEEFYKTFYDVTTKDLVFPIIPEVSIKSQAKYGTNVDNLVIEFVYKVVSTSTDQFETAYQAEYDKLVQAGLEDIIKERQDYYDNIYSKK